MSNTQKVSGVDSYVLYAKESTYGSTETTTSNWSYIQNFNPSVKNNMIATRGFVGTGDARTVSKYSPGQLDVSWSMSLIPNDWDFLEFALGSASTTGGTTDYETATKPSSFTLTNNIDNDTTDRKEIYAGCVVNSLSIKASVGESVSVDLSGVSSLVSYGTAANSVVANSTDDVWTFQHGSINIDGELDNIIDSIDLSVENNWELKYGVGSRLAQTAIPKERNVSLKFTIKYIDNTLYGKLLGASTPTGTGEPSSISYATLTFSNGSKSIQFTLTGGHLEELAETNNLNELIMEDFTLNAKDISVQWVNN